MVKIPREITQDKRVTKWDKKLGRNIAKIRKDRGLTQEQLAEMVGKSTTWIGYIETAYRIPNLKLLYKIAKALGVKVGELFP